MGIMSDTLLHQEHLPSHRSARLRLLRDRFVTTYLSVGSEGLTASFPPWGAAPKTCLAQWAWAGAADALGRP